MQKHNRMRLIFHRMLIAIACFLPYHLNGQVILTVAGSNHTSYTGDEGPATNAGLYYPTGVAIDTFGNIFIADQNHNVIRKVNLSGIISTFAGSGITGYTGDNGPATNARLNQPTCIALDSHGNLYISDESNNAIRKVNASGIITTIAGNGALGYSGDGGPATNATLANPYGIVCDTSGNVFIADQLNHVIRKINTSGTISTFAGNNLPGYSGDGGPATLCQLYNPTGVTFDHLGNLFIADANNNVIRKVNATGIITTIAGTGAVGYTGDGSPATVAELNYPACLAFDDSGSLFISDLLNNVIPKNKCPAGIITTI